MRFSKLFKYSAVAGGILCAVKGLDDRLETTHYVIYSDKLPESFDGFRIVQISDLHAACIPGLTEEIRGEKPDIIVSTGDLVHDDGPYEPGTRLMSRLTAVAPVYAVTGNHDLLRSDYTAFQRELDDTGTVTLHNESVLLSRGDESIALCGMEDPFSNDGRRIKQTIEESLRTIPRSTAYNILLFHRANHMDLLKGKGFDLILSGHMHGGQMRLPNGRGVCSPRSSWVSGSKLLFPRYFAGHYRAEGTDMIVNRGIGNPMLIPRLFNRPELTVVILRRKAKKAGHPAEER